MRLGHKGRGADLDIQSPAALLGDICLSLPHQPDYAFHIFLRLRGQTQHEIKLDVVPAMLAGGRQSLDYHIIGQAFIDNTPETLAPGLRRKCQPCFLASGDGIHERHGKAV